MTNTGTPDSRSSQGSQSTQGNLGSQSQQQPIQTVTQSSLGGITQQQPTQTVTQSSLGGTTQQQSTQTVAKFGVSITSGGETVVILGGKPRADYSGLEVAPDPMTCRPTQTRSFGNHKGQHYRREKASVDFEAEKVQDPVQSRLLMEALKIKFEIHGMDTILWCLTL